MGQFEYLELTQGVKLLNIGRTCYVIVQPSGLLMPLCPADRCAGGTFVDIGDTLEKAMLLVEIKSTVQSHRLPEGRSRV